MDKTVFFDLSYGVYAIGASDGDRPNACIANTAVQITAEPATVSISINKNNYTHDCILRSGEFSISIFSEQTAPATIGTLGFASGRNGDKISRVPYLCKGKDTPVVTDQICGWLLCRVLQTVDMGTHTVFFADVIDGERYPGQTPMTYSYYHTVVKGKTPKNAPTYQAEEKAEAAGSTRWVCSVCGYIYEGEDFSALPDSWTCPLCNAPKSKFYQEGK
ncbi:MAG TPA: flavin reductase [Firmicutes bacterium]|nr:flavin reductase [Bacillota bacterium]